MGLFGRGIAFNRTFIARGPMRPPMMPRGPMPGGMGPIFSYSESYTQKTNGWDFATTLLQTFAMTSMMFGGWGASRASSSSATPQGTTEQKAEDKCLSNLVDFYGKKFIIKAHPTRDGIYQAVPKDGGAPIDGTYDQLMEELANVQSYPTVKPEGETTVKPEGETTVKPEGETTVKPDDEATVKPDDEATIKPEDKPTAAPSRGGGAGRGSRGRAGEADGAGGSARSRQAEGTGRVDNGSGRGKIKLPITWEITPKYMGHVRSLGHIFVSMGDGTQVKLTGSSNKPRSVADAKAEIARDLEQQLKDRNLDGKYTVY